MKPMLKDGISLGIIQDGSDTIYYAENADGNRFEISRLLWDVLEKTDGSYQLDLPNKTIPLLKAMGLVRTSRFVHMKGLNSYFTLFPISNRTKDPRRWKILLYILYILSLLLFGSGFLIWASNSIRIGPVFDGTLIGCLLFAALFYSSIFLHEIGHFIAAKAFGIKTTEIGVFLFGIIITGAYTSYLRESKRDLSVLERILFSEAGIIVNLLIAGLCLIFASVYYPLSYSLTISADFITLMVITDLLPGRTDRARQMHAAVHLQEDVSITEVVLECSLNPGFLGMLPSVPLASHWLLLHLYSYLQSYTLYIGSCVFLRKSPCHQSPVTSLMSPFSDNCETLCQTECLTECFALPYIHLYPCFNERLNCGDLFLLYFIRKMHINRQGRLYIRMSKVSLKRFQTKPSFKAACRKRVPEYMT